jgi:hypothetical protein
MRLASPLSINALADVAGVTARSFRGALELHLLIYLHRRSTDLNEANSAH